MTNELPAAPSKGYRAADVLRLARELGVGGTLVKRTRTREHRAYRVAGDSAPVIIIAAPEAHTLPAGERSTVPVRTATPLAVWVLARIAHGRREFPNRIGGPSRTHVRNCMRAGLVEVVGDRLRLTDDGYRAIADLAVDDDKILLPDGEFSPTVHE